MRERERTHPALVARTMDAALMSPIEGKLCCFVPKDARSFAQKGTEKPLFISLSQASAQPVRALAS
jgi:hypothetical protein